MNAASPASCLLRLLRPWALGLGLAVSVGLAAAGQQCEESAPTAQSVRQALDLAWRLNQHLDQTGAEVVVLARRGQNLEAHGQHYSHAALAYRDGPHWRVVHKLNHCGTDGSALYRQGLGDFFLDNPFDYEAGVAVPTPELQARLMSVLRDDRKLLMLHTQRYSMLAFPWAQKYQQSNQWMLETLALADDPQAYSRPRAQAWLRKQGYEPAQLHIGTMTRLGARMTRANVAFDDHPDEQRYSGRIDTTTADSVFVWLERSGRAARAVPVR